MDSITTDFWEVLLWSFWFFIWIAALMVWFRCLMHLFGDDSLSGWGKAGWAILLRRMTQRHLAAADRMRSNQEQYIKEVAGAGPSPADQISSGKAQLDNGAITPTEFEALKAKALA